MHALMVLFARAQTCTNQSFPIDFNGKQMDGLYGVSKALDVDQCRQACCDVGPSCEVYQWSENPAEKPNCWIGRKGTIIRNGPYVAGGRTPKPTPPPPTTPPTLPPPTPAPGQPFFTIVNDHFMKEGKPFALRSGSLHYFRIPPAYWKDRMRRMKALGKQYMPLSMHACRAGCSFMFNGA